MNQGDLCLYYHSNDEKQVVGIARVIKTSYQDPTTKDERWLAVDVEPVQALKNPVTLQSIKKEPQLASIGLIRQSRLSVMPITEDEFNRVLWLAENHNG